MSTSDAERLRAGLDEDEAVAKAAWPGPWTYETEVGGFGPVGWVRVPLPPHKGAYTGLTRFTPLGTQDAETCAHIARNDPASRLRDIAAKRHILALYEEQAGYDLPEGVHDGRDPDERMRDEAVREALREVVAALAAVYEEAEETVR